MKELQAARTYRVTYVRGACAKNRGRKFSAARMCASPARLFSHTHSRIGYVHNPNERVNHYANRLCAASMGFYRPCNWSIFFFVGDESIKRVFMRAVAIGRAHTSYTWLCVLSRKWLALFTRRCLTRSDSRLGGRCFTRCRNAWCICKVFPFFFFLRKSYFLDIVNLFAPDWVDELFLRHQNLST